VADVQPFRGWRYDLGQVGSLGDVTAPPYDVISPDDQKKLYEKHPCNVVRLILNRPEPGDAGPDAIYERAATFLRRWQKEGILALEHDDAFYVYHQIFEWAGTTYERKGFLAACRLEEFGKGQVYPHEMTMPGPKADRLKLTQACRTNLSPIFGLYPDPDASIPAPLDEAIRTLTPVEVRDDLGVLHRVWAVTDEVAIGKVRAALVDRPIFIADGHHRYETACNYRNELIEKDGELDANHPANFVLMMFVGSGDPGLAILPTHRLVAGLPDLTAAEIEATLGENFEIEPMGTGDAAAEATWQAMQADGGQNVFGFAGGDGEWLFARLTNNAPMAELAAEQSDDWRGLGVAMLHRYVLDGLFTERFGQKPTHRYVHLIDEVTEALGSGECQLAALVMPATMYHVEALSAKFERMPPKSTFFYPKLLSGLVFKPLE
jgi:uncharacterized protein (DUF1015 family)